MKDNFNLGIVLAVVGSVVGVIAFFIFAQIYNPLITTMVNLNRAHEGQSIRYAFPVLGYLAITAGVLWMVALYGFATKEKWAWMLGLIATTFSLLAGFFPMIPAMDAKVTPLTGVIFVPSLILWVGLFCVRKIDWRIALLAFVSGLAYVLAFMNGVATIAKFHNSVGQDTLNGLYLMVQPINWWASAAWAIFIFALLGRQAWARVLGIGAGLMAMMGGYPLAALNMLEVGRFSLFTPSPLLSTALVIFLLMPFARKLIQDWASGKESAQTKARTVDPSQTIGVAH